MSNEIEERIRKALAAHTLERPAGGYRLVHPHGAGISTLRIVPVAVAGTNAVAIAEIAAEYTAAGLPAFHAAGVQRLNSWAVHGAYHIADGRLWQTAQWSIYPNEPAVHLAVQSILNAFGAQLPLGRSTALATSSAAALKQQRGHHRIPARWQKPLDEEALGAAADTLRQGGLAAAHGPAAVWAELPLSGDCPSRSIDPQAETALLQVNVAMPHPIAGAGYLATITLPWSQSPANAPELCRRLNELEMQQVDFPPRLGAWGLHPPGDLPGYSSFIPSTEPLGELHVAIMHWCVMRAAWLRDRFWQASAGVVFDTSSESAAPVRGV